MTCRQYDALLEKMILGEATDADLNEMASHEAQCPACAAVRAEVVSSDERLLALDQAPPMEADFHASWVRAIKEEDMNRSKKRDALDRSPDRSPDRSFPIVRWMAIAATLVFVLVGAYQARLLDRNGQGSMVPSSTDGAPAYTDYTNRTADYTPLESLLGEDMANGAVAYSMAPVSKSRDAADVYEAAADLGAGAAAPAVQEGQKIIRTVTLSLASTEYETAVAAIKELCTHYEGWTEALEEYNQGRTTRHAYLVLRIPAEKLDAFLGEAAAHGRVTSREETAEDITARYQDTQGRLATQRALMERLRNLVAGAASLTEVLELERTIADTQYNIDYLEASLRKDDSKVNYATVTINLSEEKVPDQMAVKEYTFLQRMEGAFVSGWEGFLGFLRETVLFLIAAIPYLVIALAVWGILLIALKAYRRNHPRKPRTPQPQSQADAAPQPHDAPDET